MTVEYSIDYKLTPPPDAFVTYTYSLCDIFPPGFFEVDERILQF